MGRFVLDDHGLILAEYRQVIGHDQRERTAIALLKQIYDVQAVSDRCAIVELTPLAGRRQFEEFPDDPQLKTFDPADQVFVAACRGFGADARILVASDRGWPKHESILRGHGIRIEYLC